MSGKGKAWLLLLLVLGGVFLAGPVLYGAGHAPPDDAARFPRSLDIYDDTGQSGIFSVLISRAKAEPFNVVATLIFFLAIAHTFFTSRFLKISHKWEEEHETKLITGQADKYSVSHKARLFHFLGEIEAVFGLWVVVLVLAIDLFYGWSTAVNYINHEVNFTEPMFVVVIMTLAATRPILKFAELIMWKIAGLFGGTLKAWWFTILTIGPLLGSFITEPAAMTISALLLSNKFYDLDPDEKLKYATIGLLFVNVSVGGTFSNFAAPPVLMVAEPWHWGMGYMLSHFGWKAGLGIILANGIYYLIFRNEFRRLQKQFALLMLKNDIQKKYLRQKDVETELDKLGCLLGDRMGFFREFDAYSQKIKEDVAKIVLEPHKEKFIAEDIDINLVNEAFEQRFEEIRKRKMRTNLPGLLQDHERPIIMDPDWDNRDDDVPPWVTFIHILFMVWTIYNAHYPALFIPGLLFFLGFSQVTLSYQNRIDLKPPLLVGFFLGGLVIHGGLQGWWIAPVLGNLGEIPLLFSATILTAFNDNAAITFLSTLVPGFTEGLKYTVVAGAVAGGGLTVIANAPNPAGQSLLKKHFTNGISPVRLLFAALLPTAIMITVFLFLR